MKNQYANNKPTKSGLRIQDLKQPLILTNCWYTTHKTTIEKK